jgi:hypothetical protein
LLSTTLSHFHKNDRLMKYSSSLKTRDYNNNISKNVQYGQFDSLDTARNKINDTFITCCLNMKMPFNCTKEIHDLLIECCNMNMIKRPKFKDIYTFIQCKLFGTKY